MRHLLILALSLLVSSLAFAQPSGDPIALVPLDSRPATSTLPVDIGAVGGQRVLTPPSELLGTWTKGADTQAIESWLEGTNATRAIVSLDALGYGGLVQSRTSTLTTDEVIARLEPLRAWQARTKARLDAFITIPRAPDATDRERNLNVIRRMFDWVAAGTLTRLFVTWDDALPGSPAPEEGERLRAEAAVRDLKNVRVYPGADEVASVMLSSLVLEAAQKRPTVRLEFSDASAKDRVTVYDGLPLEESATRQADAAGMAVVPSGGDLTLFVFNGGDRRAAALRLSALARRGPVALADVFDVNKAASKLLEDTVTLQRFLALYGFAAWGTPGNNLGSALAHAAMRVVGGDSDAHAHLLLRAFVNDYLYSTLVRPQVRERYGDLPLDTAMARRELLEYLRAAFKPARLEGTYCLGIADAFFPWARSFEVQVQVTVTPRTDGAPCPVQSAPAG